MQVDIRSRVERDTSGERMLMWAWFFMSLLAAGIAAGNIFQSDAGRFSGGSSFNTGAMFAGFICTAIANIPVMVFWSLIQKNVQNTALAVEVSATHN